MAVSTFEGVVENGRIRLPDHVTLPDQTRVYVVIPDFGGVPPARVSSPRLVHAAQAADFAKQIVEVTDDAEL